MGCRGSKVQILSLRPVSSRGKNEGVSKSLPHEQDQSAQDQRLSKAQGSRSPGATTHGAHRCQRRRQTSLLDALALISVSATGGLNEKLSELGGLASIATRTSDTKEVTLLVGMDVPGYEPLEYQLTLAPKGTGYAIAKEVLSQTRKGLEHPF